MCKFYWGPIKKIYVSEMVAIFEVETKQLRDLLHTIADGFLATLAS